MGVCKERGGANGIKDGERRRKTREEKVEEEDDEKKEKQMGLYNTRRKGISEENW